MLDAYSKLGFIHDRCSEVSGTIQLQTIFSWSDEYSRLLSSIINA